MVKIFLDAIFSGIPMTESFLRERIHSQKLYKIICNIFSGRFDASNTADFEISTFNLTHKVPPSTSFEIRKSLKRMPSLAYTELNQTKYRVSSMFAFGCNIFRLCYTYLHVHNLVG